MNKQLFVWKGTLAVALIFLGFQPAYPASDPLDIWHWRNPEPTGARLNGVAYGAGRYVAVGEGGVILVSEDSRHWSVRSKAVGGTLRDIAYGDGKFVAVGDSGMTFSSADGIHWQLHYAATFTRLKGVTWGNGTFVAVGDQGGIITSENGEDWTLRTLGGDDFNDVAFGGGRFVAVGGNPVPPNVIGGVYDARPLLAVSNDGVVWRNLQTPVSHPFTGVSHGNGHWVAVTARGKVIASQDLGSWLQTDLGLDFSGTYLAGFGGGRFVLMGGSSHFNPAGNWVSSDGWNWEFNRHGYFINPPEGICYGDDGFVAVGGQWSFAHPNIVRSEEGQAWEKISLDTRLMQGRATFTGGHFYVQNNQPEQPFSFPYDAPRTDVWKSQNGQDWKQITMSPHHNLALPVWGNDRFVSVGRNGAAAISNDGEQWILSDTSITNTLAGLAFGDSQFVAVGSEGTILNSSDGLQWESQSSGTLNDLINVAWNGKWVATEPAPIDSWREPKQSGAILASIDGTAWTRHPLPEGINIQTVVPWKSGFAGMTANGRAAVSPDGLQWSVTGPTAHFNWISAITVVGDLIVHVPDYQSATLAVSEDGTNWTSKPLPWPPSAGNHFIPGITSGNGTVLVVEGTGKVIQSDPIEPMAPIISNPLHVTFGGPGRESTITGAVSGSSPFTFQWQRNSADIPGATNIVLELSADEPQSLLYSLVASNALGTVQSESIELTGPVEPELWIDYNGVYAVTVRGSTGRRHILETTAQIETESGKTIWTESGYFRIEVDGEVKILPAPLTSDRKTFFRARVVE